jgi:prefoldin beta subunit
LNLLDDDANVFKMLGPALVKQDLPQSKETVEKRLQFIRSEMYVSLV